MKNIEKYKKKFGENGFIKIEKIFKKRNKKYC